VGNTRRSSGSSAAPAVPRPVYSRCLHRILPGCGPRFPALTISGAKRPRKPTTGLMEMPEPGNTAFKNKARPSHRRVGGPNVVEFRRFGGAGT